MEKWGKLSSINRKSVDSDFDLTKSRIEIGRTETCDIHIDNAKISKVHCVIERDDSGQVFIEDKSSNGTYVFDELIGKDKKRQIGSGDIIYLLHKDKVKGKCEDVGLVFSPFVVAAQHSQQPADVAVEHDDSKEQAAMKQKEEEILKIKEQLKNERNKKKEMAEQLGEDFKCGICCEFIYDCATISPCLHNFCAGCLSELLLTSNVCPLCRDPINQVKKNSQINTVIDRFVHKQPDLKRLPEEYEELDLKNIITPASSTIAALKALASKKLKSKEYKNKLEEIRERMTKRMNRQIDSDYSYESEDEGDRMEEEKAQILPLDCPECKIPRSDDGFKCPNAQVHLSCTSCSRKFPDRPEKTCQRCVLCKDPYCGLYLGVCKGSLSSNKKTEKSLKAFEDYKAPATIANQIFRNNKAEYDILQEYLRSKKMNCQSILDYMNEKQISKGSFFFEKSKAILANYTQPAVRTIIESQTPICQDCFNVVWHQVVFRFRVLIKDQLNPQAANRPPCHWGINCTTQVSKQSHADRFDHACEQTRF